MRRRAVFLAALLALCVRSWGADASPPRHDFPPVGKHRVLVGDFHMHTDYGEPNLPTPRQRVEESYRLGYDVIAVTDHGTTRAWRVANYVGSSLGLIVIRGIETGVRGNEHMGAIGVSGDYKPVNPHNWSKKPGLDTIYYRDAMKQVAESGGFLIYNHPHCGYHELVHWGIREGILIGIEVRNDICKEKLGASQLRGIYCYPEAFDFALQNNLAVFADTDVHGWRIEDPARTLVLVEESSAKGVMDAIRARRTAAWFQGVLWGRQALLADLVGASVTARRADGGEVVFENRCPIAFRARVEGAQPPQVELPAYQTAALRTPAEGDVVNVTWENVWTDPRTNLRTAVRISR